MNIKKIFSVGILNTLRLNIHYFGVKEIFHPRIIASKNLKILSMRGTVTAESSEIGAIQIGFGHVGVIDNRYCRALWENSGDIVFSGRANFGPGTRIVNFGTLIIGDDVCINAASNIICYNRISIGSGTLISWECLAMNTDFHKIFSVEDEKQINQINRDRPIEIGDNVWIGCRTTILKGSKLPSESIVAAGSVICQSYSQTNAIYSSCGEIKDHITWSH